MEISNNEMHSIVGGASYTSSSFLNAASRLITTILNLGQTVGSCIRRGIDKSICSC